MHPDWQEYKYGYLDRYGDRSFSIRLYHIHTTRNWHICLAYQQRNVSIDLTPLQAQVLLSVSPVEAEKLITDRLRREDEANV